MRDMGDTTAYLRRGIREIICLALFFFTFLACEYLFDARMAEFVSPDEVVIYESLVIGASVIGFFVRPILYYRRPHAIEATSDVTGVLLVAALLLLIMAVQVEVVIAGGLVACCALGYCGSTAHANFARRFARTPCLARAAALSYAMGVLVQVLNHMVMPAGIPSRRSSPDRGDGVSFRRIRRSQRGLHDPVCCRSRRFGRLAAPAACRELVGRWRTI